MLKYDNSIKLTVNSIVDISRSCILYLTPNTSTSQSVSPSEHNGAFLRLMGKMFFLQSCAKCPVMEIYGLKLPISLSFLGFLFSALSCFLSHLVFKFCIIAHGSNQEEKMAEVCEVWNIGGCDFLALNSSERKNVNWGKDWSFRG